VERQFAVYHGLGKGWCLASPRLPPLPGGRAGPLLGFPVAKRMKSAASKSVNNGSLLGCGAKRPCRSSGLRRGCRSARSKGPSPCSLIWLRARTKAKPQAPSNPAPSSNSNPRLPPFPLPGVAYIPRILWGDKQPQIRALLPQEASSRAKGKGFYPRQVFQVTNRSPGQEGGSRRPPGLAANLTQRRQELLPVLVVPEDRLPLIPAIHHVVNRSRILHSELSGHPANRVCTLRQISQALQILCSEPVPKTNAPLHICVAVR
jgi:hypothetical protein